MTFIKIIKSMDSHLRGGQMYRDFLIASSFSMEEKYQAYFLGLFFRYLKIHYRLTYDTLNEDFNRLNEYFDSKGLSNYFKLKNHLTISTKKPVAMYVLFAFGLAFIILGIKNHINGLYTVDYNLKTQLPVYMTGLLGVIYGLTAIWISASVIRINLRKIKFYKKYAEDFKNE